MSLSALAVGGYLERTALYAQAVAELHGVHVHDAETARSMVMAIMLGDEGSQLMNTVLLQTGKGQAASPTSGACCSATPPAARCSASNAPSAICSSADS